MGPGILQAQQLTHAQQCNHVVTQTQQLSWVYVARAARGFGCWYRSKGHDTYAAKRMHADIAAIYLALCCKCNSCCECSNSHWSMLYAQHGDLAKHQPGFGVSVSDCFDVSSQAATPETSNCFGSLNTDSTSRVWRSATNFERSEPEKVTLLPLVFISLCASWMYAHSSPVIDCSRIHFAIWLCGLFK